MTENVKKEVDGNNPKEEPKQAVPTRKEKDIEKILQELPIERNEKDHLQRFGYFSIPYASTIGDQAYSRNAEYHHKVVDRKVITENRGIYAQGTKSGKTPDVYFPPPESTEKLIKQKERDEALREKRKKKKKKNWN